MAARVEGPWWWLHLVSWCMIVHLATSLEDVSRLLRPSFRFTQDVYNASILENSVGKTFVTPEQSKMGMYVKDPTLNIKYRIISGDVDKFFKADERLVGDFCFLRIRTRSGVHKAINRESQETYKLIVKGVARYKHGPSLSAQTEVRMRVEDANDLSPLFYPTSYFVEVKEDTQVNEAITTVSAEDADIGVNGQVYYSFSQKTDTFAVHPTSGVVYLTKKLSFIEESLYELDILAEDRGPRLGRRSRVSLAKLQVSVLEVNFYSPVIDLQELPAVIEHGGIGTIYAILYVHDKDYGENGEIDKVKIIDGDPDGYFRLRKGERETEYNIQVSRNLDREIIPEGFNLTVQAMDKGSEPKTTTRNVHVRLADINDQAPEFGQDEYEISVDEVVPVHTPLIHVKARDSDSGRNGDVVYHIADGNKLNWFEIEKYTGLVSVGAPLDAEKVKNVELTISGQDRANAAARKIKYVTLKITINDCNDNAPVFNDSQLTVSVEESQPIGSDVYKIAAYDLDKGDNGYISYSIANLEDSPFAIDHFSGLITTSEILDYEAMRRTYKLLIRASDWGSPHRRESESIITVKVRDVNDNKPQFEKVDCIGHLSREAPVGTQLVTVSAIDFDAGNIISYQIIGGNEDSCFEIKSSTGSVQLKCDLRQFSGTRRSLSVTATDGKNQADPIFINITLVNNNRNHQLSNRDANINCRLTEVTRELSKLLRKAEENNNQEDEEKVANEMNIFMHNAHNPLFPRSTPRSIHVEEGLPPNHKVLTLRAIDPDPGYNGKLLYVINSGNAGGVFRVDIYSGDLIVMEDLDREKKDKYELNVTVSDMGHPSKSASLMMHISVLDINDNAPSFDRSSYSLSISEDVRINTTILQVSASDKDIGENAEIRFSIVTDTSDFHIDPKSGVIYVAASLDRERQEKYELYVQATDGATDIPMSSTVLVTIKLEDINDNAPTFTPDIYHVRVREDLPVGTVVMAITAHDPDTGGGGTVRYNLQGGMEDKFEIDRTTGTIRITNKLNYEIQQMYNMTARARDRGNPQLSSRCQIFLEVIDVNENLYAPRFSDFVFQGSIKENMPRNTTVLQLSSTDDDVHNPDASEKDYEITYSIRDGSGLGIFTINNQGVIRANEILDRESTSHYWLTVYAQDRGTIPKTTIVEVYIEVEDVNDNVPQTYEPVYYPAVQENSNIGTSVVRIEARDLDDTSNNHLTYDITSGNPQGFFDINRATGLITTTRRRLDREKQEEHILEVTVSDNGSPALSSTTRVVVSVADVNDKAPTFTERVYRVRILAMESQAEEKALFRVIAFDSDLGDNADIDYSIKTGKSGGRFRIHPKKGIIFSQKAFEAGTSYDITIQGIDNGRPQLKETTRVLFTVVERPVESINAPEFMDAGSTVSVTENDQIGHLVRIMSADDADGDKLWYSIVAGNEEDKFAMDPENGNVLIARDLDWERRNFYNLTLEATDGVNNVQTWLAIQVIDINDNRPQFRRATYIVNIAENTAPGTDIISVAATDRDEDKRLFYTIHSSTEQASRGKFKINSETGVITTIDTLNREAISKHELTIMVRDQGTPSKRSLTRVIIHVEDHNDFAPEFLASHFEGRVFETAVVGTSILQVTARDQDKGKNAEIKYSIVSGNVGSAFTIDGNLGAISVAKTLDRDAQSEYQLLIKAADGGSPSLTSTVNVKIFVTISNNAPPKFEQSEYTTELQENKPADTYVITIQASSRSSVSYAITKGNYYDLFTVNPNSGVISTTDVIDFEKHSFFNLTICATNMVGAKADTIVLIHVIDQNDNQPLFTQVRYVGNISEAALAGSVVLNADNAPLVVKATDADTNLNALLIYSIVEPVAQDTFDIDANTGAIRTKVALDHEVSPLYKFSVQVTDTGDPRQSAEVAANVVIHVGDINDSPPMFDQGMYESTLLLPTYPGVAILTVHASDADTDINSKLEYTLIDGNFGGHFQMDPDTGVITVAVPTKMDDTYDLTARVTDGTFQSMASVHINVKLTESSGLDFSEKLYQAQIMENQTGVEQVVVVQAVGHALNEHLEFLILNPSQMFQVGKTSGVVQTLGIPFDREQQENFTLVIEVKDGRLPPRVAHTLLHVHIQDMNDNSPVFIKQPYYAIVSVDATPGDVVKKVTAIDRDIGQNGEVQYNLVESGGRTSKFKVNRRTGEITLDRPLVSEDQNKEYTVLIEAVDKGEEPRRTQVMVPVKIMNKATPIFSQQFYSVSIAESSPRHSAIMSIEARSPTSQKLIYSITKGDIYGEFAVDFNTDMDVLSPCAITVADELDYELRKTYELTVRATDTLTGSYAEAIVHITLMDVNDQAPSFSSLLYVNTISEAAPIGTSVLSVTATDKDSGENAHIFYRIEPRDRTSNDSAYFHIDQDRGIVLTKQKLDHESKKTLSFLVTANDNGVPSLSSSVPVSLVVLDLNDNAPKFEQPVYDVTITDLVKRGQFVTIVTATDADSNDAGNLAYSIVGGNQKQAFMIDEYMGIVSLSSLRRPILGPSYMLNVSVTDGVFTNFARVHITVESSNKYVPMFTHTIYDVDVAENLEGGQSVMTVTATDDDHGEYGKISYDINSVDAKETFTINKKTGELLTKVRLDREEQVLYQVPIIAVDGGGRTGYTTVRVNVADQGDNRPQFKMNQYMANVYGDDVDGTFVLQVSAVDRDLGPNADVEYSVVPSEQEWLDATEYFSMDKNTGVVRIKKSIKKLENELFQFFVRAVDKGSPPEENDAPVEIYVMGPEDIPPFFKREVYTYFIPEDQATDSIIATVKAESNDTLRYSIVSGNLPHTNNPAKFDINDDGKIKIIEELDREISETFELMVKAETETSPPLVAYSHVTIQIMDINDNAPKFESDPYEVSIAENADVGSKVVQVIAHDRDTGANADISYDFAPEFRGRSNVFAIDAQTGWVTTLVKLDRETQAEYKFDIIGTDRGAQQKLNDITSVHISVSDHNDEPPEFTESIYHGAVNEDALPGTIILAVTTTDRDLEHNAKVTYYITRGDQLGKFNIRNTGEIYVNKELDRETKSRYELTISATDGAFVSTSQVQVTILDANDNSPVCEQPLFEMIIPENVPMGSFVARVSATDADERGTRNARIDYILEGDTEDAFVMHKKSGIISTRGLLDREKTPEYHLMVRARDGGGMSCTMDVYITITDVNDNEPKFTMDKYVVSIAENADVNTLLTRVAAVDYDLGINRQVRYAMRESDGHFSIDPVSGIVSLTRSLDREAQASFNLTLYAHDQGTPKMTSTAYLLVHLLDVNDNPPEFETSVYSQTIREDQRVSSSILRVFATSRDTGINAEIVYSIKAGNEQGKFRINAKNGAIQVVDALDYETSREYLLTVEATDKGTPPLSNTAIVRFNVTDANDNSPLFGQQNYMSEIREDAQPETTILQVLASDLDSEPNSQLRYRIVGGNPIGQFAIDPREGFVTVSGPLDRETTPIYHLEIEALDSGVPRLTGTTTVIIDITDANDNPPRFTESNYTAVVQVDDNGDPSGTSEDRELSYSILQLEVSDIDLDPNGAPFSFDIVTGNQGNEFRVDRHGVLNTASRFERQIKDTYKITVRVFDNGQPPLFSDTEVTVKIIEESAFPPIVTPLEVHVSAYNDMFPGGVIGKVKAIDKDQYDRLSYSIVSNNNHLFEIDSLDGTVTAVQSLDAGEYHINVSVSDGKFFSFSDVKLDILGIDQEMVKNSVVIRFQHMLPEEFLAVYRGEFFQVVRSELGVRTKDIIVLSIQPASGTIVTARRKRRSTDSDLDILLAVRKSQETYFRGNALRRRLTQMIPRLEDMLEVKVVKVFNDVCSKDKCEKKGQCETEIQFSTDKVFTIITDSESYASARHSLEYMCKCKSGFGGPDCDEIADACNPNPCRPPQICRLEGNLGYKCDCPEGWTGAKCDEVKEEVVPTCVEPRCLERRPLSFSGQSYAGWHLTDPMERRFSLSLEIRTVQRSARLMHAVGRVDYTILEMIEGMVQFKFDCGSGEGLVRVDSILINDDNWHLVVVERHGSRAEILIDSKHRAESSAPGTNDVLNLDSNDVFFGAEVETGSQYTDVRQGFEGCMRDIKISGITLPYSGSNSVGTFQRVEGVEFTCKRTFTGLCAESPCLNGGTCLPKGPDAYMCFCLDPFIGARCEVNTNACASNPCTNGGICENLPNDFRCRCRDPHVDKRCRSLFCRPNPCKHGGDCMEGEIGAVCRCKGFEGETCQHDINECLSQPCKNGGTCRDRHGGFECECTSETAGHLCEEDTFPSISSSAFNITMEEIIGIAGVVVGLLIIVIVFVIIVRWRRRKRRLESENSNHRDDYIYDKMNKMNNVDANLIHNIPPSPRNHLHSPPRSPRPPPVPTRPASYTPSTADSMNTLNNFDTIHNYGSAADELENVGTLPHIEIPEFLQNLDVEKSPQCLRAMKQPVPPVRYENEKKLGKAANWDPNNPNIAHNYLDPGRKEHNKKMPLEKGACSPRSPLSPQGANNMNTVSSVSSLADSEDDIQGYHWDASDWAPNSALPNITEVPVKEIPDSPASSRSNESNAHIHPDEYEYTDYPDDSEYVSGTEYVGDSEYAENEFGEDDDDDEADDPNLEYPDPPNFEQILAMHGDLNYDDGGYQSHNYNLHPNQYLPSYQLTPGLSQDEPLDDEANGNADNFARDDEDDVIHYGFPRPRRPRFAHDDYGGHSDYNTDGETAGLSAIDDMSVSMGGYTSTNASMSDISGLCDIEDSEVNLSDNDSADENDRLVKLPSSSHSHTHTAV